MIQKTIPLLILISNFLLCQQLETLTVNKSNEKNIKEFIEFIEYNNRSYNDKDSIYQILISNDRDRITLNGDTIDTYYGISLVKTKNDEYRYTLGKIYSTKIGETISIVDCALTDEKCQKFMQMLTPYSLQKPIQKNIKKENATYRDYLNWYFLLDDQFRVVIHEVDIPFYCKKTPRELFNILCDF